MSAFVEFRNLVKHFRLPGHFLQPKKPVLHAVNGVSFEIGKGEAFCLVGESGCGKTTIGRMAMGLEMPTAGEIHFDGKRIDNLDGAARQPFRRRMQMIFQNPYGSLNPRMRIRRILEEPLRFRHRDLGKAEVRDRVEAVMRSVGNDPAWGKRFPHELSGGQRQRVSIARALMVDPEFIVADEPVSALDVSVQAQVLNVMMEARHEHGLTYLFITHDLSVVRHFATRVAVMYLGTVCELAPAATLFERPRHPYTQLLLSAIPALDGRPFAGREEPGEPPNPINLPQGCVFLGRCPHANARCRTEIPALEATGDGILVACHAVAEGRI